MWYPSLPLLRFVSVSYYANFRRGTPWYDRRSRRSVASRDSLKYIDAIIRLLLRPIKRKMSVPPSQSLAHFPQIRMKWSGGLREAKNSSQKRNSTYSLVKLCDLGMGLVVLRVWYIPCDEGTGLFSVCNSPNRKSRSQTLSKARLLL